MPEPKEGENMKGWMPRCIKRVAKENPQMEQNQLVAICINMARDKGVSGAPRKPKD